MNNFQISDIIRARPELKAGSEEWVVELIGSTCYTLATVKVYGDQPRRKILSFANQENYEKII